MAFQLIDVFVYNISPNVFTFLIFFRVFFHERQVRFLVFISQDNPPVNIKLAAYSI